jgi:hypothetical protein
VGFSFFMTNFSHGTQFSARGAMTRAQNTINHRTTDLMTNSKSFTQRGWR